jgi:DNA-binding GntR family transcriptional regulator
MPVKSPRPISRPQERASSRVDTIFHELRRAIVAGEVPPGRALYEGELAAQFEVSKTPVREALSLLRAQGFVELIPYKAYLVSQISLRDMQDLFEARLMVESAIATLAAERISDEALVEIEELARLDLAFPNESREDRLAWAEHNKRFHMRIGEATGNRELIKILDLLLDKIARVVYLFYSREFLEPQRPAHLRIARALKARDAGAASRAVREHIQQVAARAVVILRT